MKIILSLIGVLFILTFTPAALADNPLKSCKSTGVIPSGGQNCVNVCCVARWEACLIAISAEYVVGCKTSIHQKKNITAADVEQARVEMQKNVARGSCNDQYAVAYDCCMVGAMFCTTKCGRYEGCVTNKCGGDFTKTDCIKDNCTTPDYSAYPCQ